MEERKENRVEMSERRSQEKRKMTNLYEINNSNSQKEGKSNAAQEQHARRERGLVPECLSACRMESRQYLLLFLVFLRLAQYCLALYFSMVHHGFAQKRKNQESNVISTLQRPTQKRIKISVTLEILSGAESSFYPRYLPFRAERGQL